MESNFFDLIASTTDDFPDLFPSAPTTPTTPVQESVPMTDAVMVSALKAPSPLSIEQCLTVPSPSAAVTMELFFAGIERTTALSINNLKQVMAGVNNRFDDIDHSVLDLTNAARDVSTSVTMVKADVADVRDDISQMKSANDALSAQIAALQAQFSAGASSASQLSTAAAAAAAPTRRPCEDTILALFFAGVLHFTKTDSEGEQRMITGSLDHFRSPENVEVLRCIKEEFGSNVPGTPSISDKVYALASADAADVSQHVWQTRSTFDDEFTFGRNAAPNRGGFPLPTISGLESAEFSDAKACVYRKHITHLTKNAYGHHHGLQTKKLFELLNANGFHTIKRSSGSPATDFFFGASATTRSPIISISITAGEMAKILRRAVESDQSIFSEENKPTSMRFRQNIYPSFFQHLWSPKCQRPSFTGIASEQVTVSSTEIQFLTNELEAAMAANPEDFLFDEEAEAEEDDNDFMLPSPSPVLGKRSAPCDDTLLDALLPKRLRSSDEEESDGLDTLLELWSSLPAKKKKNPSSFVATNIILCFGNPKWPTISRDWKDILKSANNDIPRFCRAMKALIR